jgi:hypothetical protein
METNNSNNGATTATFDVKELQTATETVKALKKDQDTFIASQNKASEDL